MHPISRRTFLKTASATAACAAIWNSSPLLMANPLGLPLGLQLYSVRDLLPKDYDGTLQQLSKIGYTEVEAAGFFGRSAQEVKRSMDRAGLHCVSAHYPMSQLMPKLDETVQYGKDLGLQYIICAAPMPKDASKVKGTGSRANMNVMTLDDWKWAADQFNMAGEKVNAAGMKFGYHNHTGEFRAIEGKVPFDELLRQSDPAKVSIEMGCGWVIVGGAKPVDYLNKYPNRISMLHVKDFKLGGHQSTETEPPPSAELGQGNIDYRPIFEAAKKADIKHAFVEQEQFDMAPMDALKIDADYMRALRV